MHARLLLLILLVAPNLFGATISLTLASMAEQVRKRNPALAAARLTVEEARGRLIGAGRLANPTLSAEVQNESRISPRTVTVSADQAFPITRRLAIERQISAQLVMAAELEVRDAERRLAGEAQALVVRVLALDEQVRLRKRQGDLALELATFAREGAQRGEISALDAAQAQMDVQRANLDSRRLAVERVGLVGELKSKIGAGAADVIRIDGQLPPLNLPPKARWQGRPDLEASLVKLESAKQGVDLAKAKKWQDLTVGIFAAQESMDNAAASRERTGFVGVRFSLPLPLWNKNEGEILERAAGAERAALETRALANAIANEAATARAEMEASHRLAAETSASLLPLIQEQTEALEKAYRAGQADLMSLLRAREQRLQMEASLAETARDFHLARVRYFTATGGRP